MYDVSFLDEELISYLYSSYSFFGASSLNLKSTPSYVISDWIVPVLKINAHQLTS